jgi:hypothetical protein
MEEEVKEADDGKIYQFMNLYADTVHFLTKALHFYRELLATNLKALESDKDIKELLEIEPKEASVIRNEILRVKRAIDWIEKIQESQGRESPDYDFMGLTHGFVRFLKSVGVLYVAHLRQRRNEFAARTNVSKYAVEELDAKLSKFEEKVKSTGVFGRASTVALLVDELAPLRVTAEIPSTGKSEVSLANVPEPRPVMLERVQVLDAQLKERCLDLFNDFTQKGQHKRFDTVIVEATRILEDRLRSKMEVTGQTGDELAVMAFGPKPKLRVSDVDAEQQAVLLFFKGIFGYIRNPPHHKLLGELSPERTLQILALLDYAIHIVESATRD